MDIDPNAPHEDLVAAAGICADLEATSHVFNTRVGSKRKPMIKQRAYHDFDPDDLMEHLPWLVHRTAVGIAKDCKVPEVEVAFQHAASELLRPGPKDFSQVPAKLSEQTLAKLGAGENVLKVLADQWRSQVQETFTAAWGPWKAALEARAKVRHPLVRIAIFRKAYPDISDGESLIRHDPLLVRGRDGALVVTSALVHPSEAEVLFAEQSPHTFRLLPSAGVSQERLDTARRLRAPYEKGSDAPMRSLAAALAAAADVLGEPVFGAPYRPEVEEVLGWMKKMLPEEPTPKPTPKRSAWTNAKSFNFAIAA